MSSKLPGSSKSKHQDDFEDWENHIVLRVPDSMVDQMNKVVDGDNDAKELGIDIFDDNRTVEIKLGEKILSAKILDLPTITEVHKTLDNSTLYKVADVSQIIVVEGAMPVSKKEKKATKVRKEEPVPVETEQPAQPEPVIVAKTPKQLAKERIRQFQFPHGLVPPMRNARKKRFRTTKQKKLMGVVEIETALKRILRDDLEATSVHWEIVDADGSTQEDGTWEEDYDADDGSDTEKEEEEDKDEPSPSNGTSMSA